MATILGTVGVFGLENEQQGMILESQDMDYKPESKIQRDYRGKKTGIIFYDEQTDISLKGSIPRADSTDIKLGVALSLANEAPAFGLSSTAGTTVVMGVKVGLKNEDLATLDISATTFDFATAQS